MAAPTACATCSGWSVCSGIPWSICSGISGQLAAEWSGQLHRNLQTNGLTHERITKIATFQYPGELMNAHTIPRDFQNIAAPKTKHAYPEFELELC